MIKITFPEPDAMEWQEWCQECRNAKEALIAAVKSGKEPQVTDLYKDGRMKRFYKSSGAPFYGKCAYCETDVLVSQPGDIEHWRPKGRVIDQDGRPIQLRNSGTNECKSHPGYYWLAYEWRNLLLACADCNRPSKAKTAGRGIGKWDKFPVRAFRAERPGEEEREDPLLINPMDEDPSDHIEVDETGILIAKTDRGQECIDMFGLNDREALVGARRQCIKNTTSQVSLASLFAARASEGELGRELVDLKKVKLGAVPFSAAGRVALDRGKDRLLQLVENL